MNDSMELPTPSVHRRKRGRPSAVWIVPILAIVAAVALAVRTYLAMGPTIRIQFDNAEGIESGKSDVRFKNVVVGQVASIELTPDKQHIVATVKLTHGAAGLAVKDTRFWVERPRIGVGGVSGLGTLLSGAYIGVDVGASSEEEDYYVGLEKPPGVTHDQHGTRFRLSATDVGSLGAQSPVYFRRQSVGTIASLDLSRDGKRIDIEIFVQAPFDKFVTDGTVFWNSSGLDVTIDATGLRVNTQSLATVVAGGVAFGYREPDAPGKPAAADTVFQLFEDPGHALARPDTVRLPLAMHFDEPIRGLGNAIGANIELEGIHIGDVTAVHPGYDPATHAFFFDVDAMVYPARLGPAYTTMVEEGARTGKSGPQMLQSLVARGLRAQFRSGNLLTGSFYIALDWFPKERPAVVAERDGVWVVPTMRGGTEQIQAKVESIISKIDRIPFDTIGGDVHDASRAAASLLGHLDHDVTPQAQALFAKADLAMGALRDGISALRDNLAAPDSAIQQSTRTALEQVERAAFSLRGLAEYLKHHPESLLRGRDSAPEPK